MHILFYVLAGICGLAAIQERRDYMRCFACVLFAVIFAAIGYAGYIGASMRH